MSATPFRRLLGATILLLSSLPVFRLLVPEEADAPFRERSVAVAQANLEYALWGAVTTLLLGFVVALLLPGDRFRASLKRVGDRLVALPTGAFALTLGSASTVLAALVNRFVYQRLFTNVDEMASAVHASYFAKGAVAGTLPGLPEAWLFPNMLVVDAGWVSQFPPGHLAVMAAAMRLGVLWMAGPILLGVFVGLTALTLPRILVDHPATARVAAIAVAFSPFMAFIGGGSLSHTTAGAAGALALYCGLRARDGGAWWAVATGAAVGLMVTARPWIGLVLGSLATLGVWLLSARSEGLGWTMKRVAGTLAGGLPFAVFLGWFNAKLFGSPATMGYITAFGETHELGFHSDPWGYPYSFSDALGFTSTDLLSFGIQLLETPLPIGAVIGLWLLTTRKLPRGARFLAAWAFLPVAANFVYWFHEIRMLYEAAPAWIALGVLAVVELSGTRAMEHFRIPARDWILASSLVAVAVSVAIGIPSRVRTYRWSDETLERISPPPVPGPERALVFVHASWTERLSAQLQGAGMRQDSITTSVWRNTNCTLQRYVDARQADTAVAEPEVAVPDVDLRQLPGTPPGIRRPPAPEGTTLRIREGEPFPPECERELRADRFGAVTLAPLLWQGDLPGVERGRPLFVRDLGPETNARLRSFFPARTPWVFVPKGPGAPPELVPYEEGMRVLWGPPPAG